MRHTGLLVFTPPKWTDSENAPPTERTEVRQCGGLDGTGLRKLCVGQFCVSRSVTAGTESECPTKRAHSVEADLCI